MLELSRQRTLERAPQHIVPTKVCDESSEKESFLAAIASHFTPGVMSPQLSSFVRCNAAVFPPRHSVLQLKSVPALQMLIVRALQLLVAQAVFVTEPAGGAGRRCPGLPQAVQTESALEQVAEHVIPVPMIHPLPGQLWHPEQLPFIDAI